MIIKESGLRFTFEDDSCFRIEKDDLIVNNNGIKACECVALLRDRCVHAFIEAKSSAPQCNHEQKEIILQDIDDRIDVKKWRIKDNFDIYIEDICQKFKDSFSAMVALQRDFHGAHAASRIPHNIMKLRHDNVIFVLIIGKNFKDEWLPPLCDSIKESMRPFLRLWNIPDKSVKVANCDLGRNLGIDVTATE